MDRNNKIPEFSNGLLLPGCYEVTLDEFKERFVDDFPDSKTRKSRFQAFLSFYKRLMENVKSCRRLSCRRLIINGSFVSDKLNPYDVDFVLVIDNDNLTDQEIMFLKNERKHMKLLKSKYLELVNDEEFFNDSKLYELDFYSYGCDFAYILRFNVEDELLYKIYLDIKFEWINLFGNTRENVPKGILTLYCGGSL